VKRDVHQFRVSSWFVILLSLGLTLLLASVPAAAQNPSETDDSLTAKGDGKPNEDAKSKDAAKPKEEVKKDTPGFAIKPNNGSLQSFGNRARPRQLPRV